MEEQFLPNVVAEYSRDNFSSEWINSNECLGDFIEGCKNNCAFINTIVAPNIESMIMEYLDEYYKSDAMHRYVKIRASYFEKNNNLNISMEIIEHKEGTHKKIMQTELTKEDVVILIYNYRAILINQLQISNEKVKGSLEIDSSILKTDIDETNEIFNKIKTFVSNLC